MKYHCQIGDEKCVVDANGRHDAADKLGYCITGVVSVNPRESVYAVVHDGQRALLAVAEMEKRE